MKIRYKSLMRAIQFAFLPTISLLLLLFFGFFSIEKTINFITSDNGWAIAIRIVAFLAEIVLIWTLYHDYAEEEKQEELIQKVTSNIEDASDQNWISISPSREMYMLSRDWGSRDTYKYIPIDTNHALVKRIPEVKKDHTW